MSTTCRDKEGFSMSMREYRKWFFQKEDGSETLEVLALTAIAAAIAVLAARVFQLAKGEVSSKAQQALG